MEFTLPQPDLTAIDTYMAANPGAEKGGENLSSQIFPGTTFAALAVLFNHTHTCIT